MDFRINSIGYRPLGQHLGTRGWDMGWVYGTLGDTGLGHGVGLGDQHGGMRHFRVTLGTWGWGVRGHLGTRGWDMGWV